MDIPAPVSVGDQLTTAIPALPGSEALLRECREAGRVPVVLHELGEEKERATTGPRELLERTQGWLGSVGGIERWGAGARVRTPEDAAQFALAGFTWFTLDVARMEDRQAETMSLEGLDAAIVSLEDHSVLRERWHEDYVGREFETATGALRFSDEALARIAVKHGPILALAGEINRAIRACWSGRPEAAEIEVSLAPGGPATTREEFLFLSRELLHHVDTLTAIAPALGHEFEPGAVLPEDPAELAACLAGLRSVETAVKLSIPSPLAPIAGEGREHFDTTEAARLAALRRLAQRAPGEFRQWLEAARLAFPLARNGWPISLGEEEARFLPQVEDEELEATFLGTIAGRQLLLATWEAVTGEFGARLALGA
jgi:hypothetical protein